MRRSLLITLSIAAGLALESADVRAAGEVVITQSTAMTGGVTPGDTPGFPVTISNPGTYVLGSAIQLTTGIAFEVTAGNVTLDLAGQEIDGHGGANIGVRGRGIRMVVKNGNIQRFKINGITNVSSAPDAAKSDWTIDHVAVFDNGRAGIVCGRDCQILNSTVTGNGFINTTAAVYPGIQLDTGVVIGSTISRNSSYGIEATQCAAYGHNFLLGNNQVFSGTQVNFNVYELTPNFGADNCPSPARGTSPAP